MLLSDDSPQWVETLSVATYYKFKTAIQTISAGNEEKTPFSLGLK